MNWREGSSGCAAADARRTKLSIGGSLLLGLLDDVGLVLVLLQPGIALADYTLGLRELPGILCNTHDFDWVYVREKARLGGGLNGTWVEEDDSRDVAEYAVQYNAITLGFGSDSETQKNSMAV